MPPILVVWPLTPIQTDKNPVRGHIVLPVADADAQDLEAHIRRVREAAQAWAVLVVLDTPEGLQAELRSPVTTTKWTAPALNLEGLGWGLGLLKEE